MDTSKLQKLSDFPSCIDTPFVKIDDMEYKTFWTKEKPRQLTDIDTGEVMSVVEPSKKVEGFNDTGKYTKLFTNGKLKLAELSSAGTKVVCYIMLNAIPNQEDICLHPQLVAKEMGYKDQRSVYEGLVDILKSGLIARKTGYGSYFWINPNLFFNGDRTKLLSNPVREEFRQQLIKENVQRQKDYVNFKD